MARRLSLPVTLERDPLDIYLGAAWVRRTHAASVTELSGPAPPPLAPVAEDARTFSLLRAGARVRFQNGGADLEQGRLLEKCRFGAIVESDDGRLLGVGFRKLWSVPDGEPA